MKKLLLPFLLLILLFESNAQPICNSNHLTNADFTGGLTSWSQYGTITTAIVIPITNACIQNTLALPATTNSNTGVEQVVVLKQDTCYDLCYCYEFPQSGSLFNSRLLLAGITSGVTVTQLLSGAFTPTQAQIFDQITSSTVIPPTYTCTGTFQATGNFTSFVVVNETTGPIGTDVRVDNICLSSRNPCPVDPCDSLDANFSYTVSGNTVNFTDISTSPTGSTLGWNWDFGDPPSGVNNTSILQNPSHTYPGPGIYFVCLYLSSVSADGLTSCHDTFCIDVIVPTPVGINDFETGSLVMLPNPADEQLHFKGTAIAQKITLFNSFGQLVFETAIKNSTVELPRSLAEGVYNATIQTDKGILHRKLMIKR
jgi:PKD repeat protein